MAENPPIRVGVFGWGIVAPKSPNIAAFKANLASSETWLAPFNGFGPDNFLVGDPEFRFADYRPWVEARFPPRRFQQLEEKADLPAQYAIGAFIQGLCQNPGLERELQQLGTRAHVYVGTGIGSIGLYYDGSITLYHAQRRWDRFWAQPERNSALREFLATPKDHRETEVPANPETVFVESEEREATEQAWSHYWAARSPELQSYLDELAQIENLSVEGEVETAKLRVIREKERLHAKLQKKWGAPEPPWMVSANLIWNIHNGPAAQISMLGKITGLSFAPVAACSTFGVALRLAMNAIRSGEAKAVVVGATDPPPHPLVVGAFYSARVISANRSVSVPLTHLRGTHVSGGSVVWIVGDFEYMKSKGFKPIGMEPLGVGLSSDAHHIITPTWEGPRTAILEALADAQVTPETVGTWDLHATGTPGDFSEISCLRTVFPDSVLVTARKGTFGHGMGAGGGWELTAQYLGQEQGQIFRTPLAREEVNPSIGTVHDQFVFDADCKAPSGLAGKLSMGIGGINACVISRPLR
jgi:3-oxoacyl-[acyl-carrier-protein] synthase II